MPARTITRPEVMEAMTHLASPFAQRRGQYTPGCPATSRSARPEALAACLSEAASSSLRVREHEVESNEVFDLPVKF